MLKKALVTLVVGELYRDRFFKLCLENWQQYADKQGYNLVIIDTPIDLSERAKKRPINWQKALILSHPQVKDYDRAVWIDSDILINPHSPCIVEGVPEDKIGAVDQFAEPLTERFPENNQQLMDRAVEFWQWSFQDAKSLYRQGGLPDTFDRVVQTGVMVFSPRYHRDLLENYYHQYEADVGVHVELESLSYEILKADCIHWIDYRFNRLWIECMLRDYPFLLPPAGVEPRLVRAWKRLTRGSALMPPQKITEACLNTAFINNYFLHFAGTAGYMSWVDTQISSWKQLRSVL
ncbi:MAG: hypothetical protein LRZ84_12070 [Desertifilum sp.]|nr:hypothetical protein [Desertifilum sp.]